jgi:hypothetical protein
LDLTNPRRSTSSLPCTIWIFTKYPLNHLLILQNKRDSWHSRPRTCAENIFSAKKHTGATEATLAMLTAAASLINTLVTALTKDASKTVRGVTLLICVSFAIDRQQCCIQWDSFVTNLDRFHTNEILGRRLA